MDDFLMSTETESSLATRPSLLARLKDWSQQTAWRKFDHDYTPLLRNELGSVGQRIDSAPGTLLRFNHGHADD